MPLHNHPNAVELVTALLSYALEQRASDIHFDPYPEFCRVRLRIDGMIHAHSQLPTAAYQAVLTRIKTLSGLDIAQQRIPQDGRWVYYQADHPAQFRVHTCASIHGEKLVLRSVQAADQGLTLEELGLLPAQFDQVLALLAHTHGLILLCGPTGSGKTMSLYAMLRHLREQHLQIITLEDPVEIALEGISQLQINRKQQLDFATLLRASLRQDPDVIMIGEIRDHETAEIAVRAALTGHLVLASLHTPNATASLARLRNMGIASYDLDECLRAVIAQRLVRVLDQGTLRGRTGLFEVYQPNQCGLRLEEVAGLKVQAGITTLEEVQRVL
jgi:type II secretory ATPase GspE/PulE/Tfp pilus assembly ATPase PilB-like protein